MDMNFCKKTNKNRPGRTLVFNSENIGNNPFQDTKLLPNKDSFCNSIKITIFSFAFRLSDTLHEQFVTLVLLSTVKFSFGKRQAS